MTTKNRKQIVESVKTHNQVFVKNLLLEQAETTFLGGLQGMADMAALGSGLAGGALMFVPGLQPVGAGLLALSRGAGLAGGGLAMTRGLNKMFNPKSGEVTPAGRLATQAAIGLLPAHFAANPAMKAAKGVDKQINKVVEFRNNLKQNLQKAQQAENAAKSKYGTLPRRNHHLYQVNKDAIDAEVKAAQDVVKHYTDDPTTGLAYGDPGVLASNAAKAAKQQGGWWAATGGGVQRKLTGGDQLVDLDRINRFVTARGGVIKTDKQLGNLDLIPGGRWEKAKRINRIIGYPNYINAFRPQRLIGLNSEDNPNYDDSVLGRMFMGSGGPTINPFGPSSWRTKMHIPSRFGKLSPAEQAGQAVAYPTQSALQAFYALAPTVRLPI